MPLTTEQKIAILSLISSLIGVTIAFYSLYKAFQAEAYMKRVLVR
jgi:hypothetical protein